MRITIKSNKVPSQYKNANVVVTNRSPITGDQDFWFGNWSFDNTGKLTVYLEKKFVDAANAKNKAHYVQETIGHEYYEAYVALDLAKQRLSSRGINNPSWESIIRLIDKSDIGGQAHTKTCEEYDGMSELEVDKHLSAMIKDLDLKMDPF